MVPIVQLSTAHIYLFMYFGWNTQEAVWICINEKKLYESQPNA